MICTLKHEIYDKGAASVVTKVNKLKPLLFMYLQITSYIRNDKYVGFNHECNSKRKIINSRKKDCNLQMTYTATVCIIDNVAG